MRKTVLLYPAVRLTALLLSVCFLLTSVFPCITYAGNSDNGPAITSPAAILMEASTGQVIYEKDADTVLHPASTTNLPYLPSSDTSVISIFGILKLKSASTMYSPSFWVLKVLFLQLSF
jgi:hypothetical protein